MTAQKTMAIVWETRIENVEEVQSVGVKFALIDAKPITEALLGDLCNYFFTGAVKIKDLQKTPPPKKEVVRSAIHAEKIPNRRESDKQIPDVKEDHQRVAHTISQVFPTKNELQLPPSKKPNRKGLGLTITFFILLLATLPVIIYHISIAAMTYNTYRQAQCITKGNTSCTKNTPDAIQTWSENARRVLPYTKFVMSFTGKQTLADETIVTTLEKLSATLTSSMELEQVATQFANSFFTTDLSKDDTTTTVVQIEKMKTQLFSLHTNIDLSYRLIEKILESPPFPLTIPSIHTKVENGLTTIALVRERLQTAERLLMLYPYISGYKNPLQLLCLFQNTTELRPTGGFIGSLMNLTIEDGEVGTMDVQDVYAVDGQLRGHVDPPTPIKEMLQQEHWYLRDSNWDPDFSESAKRAMWFYEKETGKTVQGVVAVNSSLIVQLLTLIGSVQLPDTNDVITADNFYEKSIAYTQTDFFPGSTQKKDFLGSLTKAMINSVLGNKSISGLQLFGVIDEALRTKTIQFYFSDPEAEQIAKQFNWAGKIPSKTYCLDETTPCFFDYSAIVEANLGVNKANYYIKRTDVRDVTLTSTGKVTETQTRTITNTNANQAGSGVYKAYVRWYVPKSARITNFTIDGNAVPAKQTGKNKPVVYPYGEIDAGDPVSTILGLAFVLAPNTSTTVALSYEYTPIVNTDTDLRLHLYSQKQSGVDDIPTITRIHIQSPWQIEKTEETPGATLANDGYLEYNSTMSEDSDIQMHFIKE